MEAEEDDDVDSIARTTCSLTRDTFTTTLLQLKCNLDNNVRDYFSRSQNEIVFYWWVPHSWFMCIYYCRLYYCTTSSFTPHDRTFLTLACVLFHCVHLYTPASHLSWVCATCTEHNNEIRNVLVEKWRNQQWIKRYAANPNGLMRWAT